MQGQNETLYTSYKCNCKTLLNYFALERTTGSKGGRITNCFEDITSIYRRPPLFAGVPFWKPDLTVKTLDIGEHRTEELWSLLLQRVL